MIAIDELTDQLVSQGIKLWVEGDRLRVSAPNNVMSAELKAALSSRKDEIVAFLNSSDQAIRSNQIPVISRRDAIGLSFAQRRLWELNNLQANSSIYNIPFAFRLKGTINIKALEDSLLKIQERHDSLRTYFPVIDLNPTQYIDPSPLLPFKVSVPDNQLEDQINGEAQKILTSVFQKSFDLETGPLWRVELIPISTTESILAFTMHHMIFDGWSKNIFVEELATFYNAYFSEEIPLLPKLPIQYIDYTHWHQQWLSSEALERQRRHWKNQLAGTVVELQLPADRAATDSFRSEGANQHFSISTKLEAGLQKTSRQHNVSLFITLFSAFNILLHRYTGQQDLLVCLPVACRNNAEIQHLIGFFNNIIVMRTNLSGDPTIRDTINRIRPNALTAYDNQDFPFQKISEFQNFARVSLSRGMFSFRNAPDQSLDLYDVSGSPIEIREQSADFDLAMYIRQKPDGIEGTVRYNSSLFDAQTISILVVHFQQIMEAVVNQPGKHLSELPFFGKKINDVELLLRSHSQIEDACIVGSHPDSGVEKQIAYLVPNQHDMPEIIDIRNFLKKSLPSHLIPDTYVPMVRFPLTETGAIDYDNLPTPTSQKILTNNVYKAPRTVLEKELTKLWTKVLWLEQEIGINDNFFDLGGHSLLSVQLVHGIEKTIGRKLPMEALLKLGTIEELAIIIESMQDATASKLVKVDKDISDSLRKSGLSEDIYHELLAHTAGWQGKRVTEKSLIMGLNTESTNQRLFWCFQGFDEFSQLAKYLGADQPVYGMRSGHLIMDKNEENIQSLAYHYADQIQAVQPKGPYLIGGNCQSAKIAFGIAKCLQQKGKGITLLCLQEQFIAKPFSGRIALFYGNESINNPLNYFDHPETGWKQFYRGSFSVNIIKGKHGQFFKEPNIQILAEKLRHEIKFAKEVPITQSLTKPEKISFPKTAYKAVISTLKTLAVTPGECIYITVNITNISPDIWRINNNRLALGSCCYAKRGHNILLYDRGTPISNDVSPQKSIEVLTTLTMPSKPGKYRFELDLIDGLDIWFKDQGSAVATIYANSTYLFIVFRWWRYIKKFIVKPPRVIKN